MSNSDYPKKLTPEVKASAEAKLAALEEELAPYGWSLTDKERKGGLKMGSESVDFVQSAIAAIRALPDVMSRRFNPDKITDTYEGNRALEPIVARLEALTRSLSDAAMKQGSVAYKEGLDIYDEFGKQKESDSSLIPWWQPMAERFDKLRGKRPNPNG